jgi:hypothetical protein
LTELSGADHDLAARIRTWADAHGVDAGAACLRVVHERLLARMDSTSPLRWIVRGGRAIDLRFGGRARRTADLDLSVADTTLAGLTEVRQLLSEVCHADIGDGWTITIQRLRRSLVEGIGVVGYKAWLAAAYDARPFGEVSLDVSRAHTSAIRPEVLSVPEMLTDARLRVAMVRPEVQIAEKVHAFTRPYRGARPRPRSYDLVDAVALALFREPDLATLRAAAQETFDDRGTHALPGTLAAAPAEWATAFPVHGEPYGLAHMSTAQGLAILSAVWERAMRLPAGAHGITGGGRRSRHYGAG